MKTEERKILNLFAFNYKLKFSDIERALGVRSNKLAYYLKELVEKGILLKNNESYELSETVENLIPYFSEKTSPLPIILIRIGDGKRCFLYPRQKRPFKGKLSLPGGRLLLNESISQAVERIMKEKHCVGAKLDKIISISHEFVKSKEKALHSFLLILVSVKTNDKVELSNVEENKKKIISSDYKIITSKDKEIKIKTFYTKA